MSNDLTIESGVAELMESSKDGREWDANCDKVKLANGGRYPSFWFTEIIISGLMDRVLGPGSSEMKIETGPL